MIIGFKQSLYNDNKEYGAVFPLLKRMFIAMAVINLFFYALSLIWGFSLSMLLGFLIGFVYVCICYVYVAKTVVNAVEMSEKRAKCSVITCYGVRYLGLFLLCFAAMELKIFNIIGIVIPQFYPRMAISIIAFLDRKSKRKD